MWSPVWYPMLVRGILRVNYCIKSFLCNVQVHFNCAGSHKSVVPDLGLQHFTCKFSFVQCPSAFRLRRLAQSVGRDRGPRHFSCQFLRKVTLVKCPSAFQLRRLAHSLVPGVVLALGLRHFTCKFSYKCLLCNVQTHPDAFRLRRLAQSVGRDRGPRHFSW